MIKYFSEYHESVKHGFEHLGGGVPEPRWSTIELLENKEGSRSGCLRNLSNNSAMIAIMEFFLSSDLAKMRQWTYTSAKLRIMLQYETNGVDSVENLLWPLISDNQEVIDWYRDNRRFYESADSEKKNQILSHEFYRLQIWRALNGLFAELRVDCEKALSQSEKFSKMKPRLVILRFLHALSIGDKAEMTRILLEMYSRKLRSRSFAYESGITCQFIVSYATLLAKLAWRHGYELDLDTPWIPREWLPIQPNEKYEDPWPFMQEFDIWQPFAEPWAAYSPQRPQT